MTTTTTQPRLDYRDLDGMTTAELIDVHAELVRSRDEATSHPIVHQALALRVYQVESAIAVRNAQVMADLDDAAEQRTVARIVEWLRDRSWVRDGEFESTFVAGVRLALARRIEAGEWRSR